MYNYRCYVDIFIFGSVFLFASQTGFAQTTKPAKDQYLQMKLKAQSSSIQPFEPLQFNITVKNMDKKEKHYIFGCWMSLIRFEYKTLESAQWSSLRTWWRPSVSIPPGPPIWLEPGESVATQASFYPFNSDETLLFEAGKTYEFRVLLSTDSIPLISDTAEIKIIKSLENEKEPLRQLCGNKLMYLLIPESYGFYENPNASQLIEEFVDKYPNSVYSDYMRKSYINMPIKIGEKNVRIDSRKKEIIDKYRQWLKEKETPTTMKSQPPATQNSE